MKGAKEMIHLCLSFYLMAFLGTSWSEEPDDFPYPIDIVYSWVDGNDQGWLDVKNRYLENTSLTTPDAHTANRFCNNNELLYSLRSVARHAPFFNHIYIVTMNQIPSWLADHPRITVIDHSQIFPHSADLPTFNSHAIESNLHRIPNLSEHFIYFNDDVFLGAKVSPSDFFTEDGKVKVLFSPSLSPTGEAEQEETSYRTAWRNTNALLDLHYGADPRYRLNHAPFALIKSYLVMSEEKFPSVFSTNSSHRFRSSSDYNVINGLVQYHWLYCGKVESSTMTNRRITLRDDSQFNKTSRYLKQLKDNPLQSFCLEDNMTDNSQATRALMQTLLERLYPIKAPWEK